MKLLIIIPLLVLSGCCTSQQHDLTISKTPEGDHVIELKPGEGVVIKSPKVPDTKILIGCMDDGIHVVQNLPGKTQAEDLVPREMIIKNNGEGEFSFMARKNGKPYLVLDQNGDCTPETKVDEGKFELKEIIWQKLPTGH